MAELVILILFPGLMALAASMDIFTMTISNRISIALIAGFVPAALLIGMPLPDMGMHALAGGAMLIVGFALFCCRFIGGGDAKVFAASALWIGWEHLLAYGIAMSIIGGLFTLAILMWRTQPLPVFLIGETWVERLHRPRGDIPYGVAISAGALVVYPMTVWFTG